MVRSWYRRLLQQLQSGQRRRRRLLSYLPHVDELDARVLPAFLAPTAYTAGYSITGSAVGDFNGDGKPDIVTVGNLSGRGEVSVLMNNGDGTFTPGPMVSTGNSPVAVQVGDFEGDGHLDVVTLAAYYTGAVTTLKGNGDGTFQPYVPYTVLTPPTEVQVADVNGDGHPDIIAVNDFFNTVSEFQNRGDGTFLPKVDFPGGTAPMDVGVGDFNGDGKPDVVAVNNTSFGGGVSLLLNNGTGGFLPRTSVASGTFPFAITVGDFNGDGKPDVAVANGGGSTSINVLLSNGDGTFQSAVSYNLGYQPLDIKQGDFNGDGTIDLVERTTAGFVVEPGNGDGTFGAPVLAASGAGNTTLVGDFNGDGVADLASTSPSGAIAVQLNANDGLTGATITPAFQVSAPATVIAGSSAPITVTAVDANGNPNPGFTGTVSVSTSDPRYPFPYSYTYTAADQGVHTFPNVSFYTLGTQTITATTPLLGAATQSISVVPAPATRLAVTADTTAVAGSPMTLLVTATDAFGNMVTNYTGTVHFTSSDVQAGLPADYTFTAADDGHHIFNATLKTAGYQAISAADTVSSAVSGTSNFVLVSPTAATSFTLAGGGGFIGSAHPVTVLARDPYGNVATSYNGTVHLTSSDPTTVLPPDGALVNGVGTFQVTPMTLGAQSLTVKDVVDPSMTGSESIVVTPGWATRFVMTAAHGTTAGVGQSVTVTAYDAFGNVSTVYTGTVRFASSDFQLGAPFYTFTAADAGTHTLNVTFRTAGAQSLSVLDAANPSASSPTQTGIVVTPAAPASISVTPVYGVTAGTAQPVTVTAHDAFGNVATSYAGTVAFSSSDTLAVLPAPYTFTAADAGTHTFSVTFESSGGQTFAAQDTANATSPAYSYSQRDIFITPAAVSSFAIKGASLSNMTAGQSFTVSVSAVDPFGNAVPTYTGTALFSSSDFQAGLPAAYTFTAADAGVHTFSFTLKTAGTQAVTLTDSANAAVAGTLPSVLVKPAAAGAFLTTFPSTATAGVAQTLSVTATDAFGNVATGYTGTVTFSSSDAQAGLPASYTFTNKDSGSHIFNVTLKTAGMQSVTIQDSANAALTATQSGVSVSPSAAAGAFVVTGFPATTAGVAQSFTVTVRDAYGNVTTGYTGTVTFSSSDVQAGLPASYTFTAADAGTHTFTATLKTAGTQSITVKDAANAAILGSETGINVSAAAAARFLISAPSSVTQGVGFKFTVTVVDAYGNVATGYTGKVHLSSTDPKQGTQDYTFSSSDKGVHVFSFTLNTLGSQTLTLTDTANSSLVGSFAVNVVSK